MRIQEIDRNDPSGHSRLQSNRTSRNQKGSQDQHGSSRDDSHQDPQQHRSSISQDRSQDTRSRCNISIRSQSKDASSPSSEQQQPQPSQMSVPPSIRRQSCPQPRQNRQIKFVSSDGLPLTKRRRILNACRACRRRKVRCSGEKPGCKTCSDHGHPCDGYSDPKIGDDGSEVQTTTGEKAGKEREGGLGTRQAAASSILTGSTAARGTKRRKPNAAAGNNHHESKDPNESLPSHISAHTHVPYFRYFGPTAIVPGYKQTVVRIRESRRSLASSAISSLPSQYSSQGGSPNSSSSRESKATTIEESFYTVDDGQDVSELVLHLCDVFFTNFGCNFPFLRRGRFFRDLQGKRIESILVDAMCSLAARFSLHPLLVKTGEELHGADVCGYKQKTGSRNAHTLRSQPFAQRAMSAVVEALECPTLAVVQAFLLIAYEQFGSNKDSGLWNYLGIAIRMAQDLGIQKVKGLEHRYGRLGLRPKDIPCGFEYDNGRNATSVEDAPSSPGDKGEGEVQGQTEEEALERERVDTFWSIFFLDRVISSGTGRPVTLLDGDIEIAFPLEKDSLLWGGLPSPFPMLLRVIHLYGRITDLLNGIEESSYVSSATLERLMNIEKDLTGLYQLLSPKLHFNVVNFQKYVKAGEGTNFILLHLWFHTLIVLLHQPTLLHSFGGQMQRLVPNTKSLSISSAKTIVDILAFAELIDAKSFIGNPFTSQPIYISACAFLAEQHNSITSTLPDKQHAAREFMITSSPQENYQKCYEALKSIKVYWEGCRYIITVLDQKAKGIVDPQLFTDEEWDGAVNEKKTKDVSSLWMKTATSAASSAWNKAGSSNEEQALNKNSGSKESLTNSTTLAATRTPDINITPGQAIGWALTGDTGLQQPNVSFLYQIPSRPAGSQAALVHRDGETHMRSGEVLPRVRRESDISTIVSPSTKVFGHRAETRLDQRQSSTHPTIGQHGFEGRYTHRDGERESERGYSQHSNFGQQDDHVRQRRQMPNNTTHFQQSLTPPAHSFGIGSDVAMDIGMQDVDVHDFYDNLHVDHTPETPIGNLVQVQYLDQQQQVLPIAINGQLLPLLDYFPADVLSHFVQEFGQIVDAMAASRRH